MNAADTIRTYQSSGIHISQNVEDAAISGIGAFFEKISGVDRVTLGRAHIDPEKYLSSIRRMNEQVPLRGKRILEIGAGYGISLALLLKLYDADAIGVEPASEGFDDSFKIARKILIENSLDSTRVVNASGESLPFDDASFDVVFSNNVLEHTSNPATVLSEAVRVLRPGGTLYVEVPNYLSYFEGHYLIPQPPVFFRSMLVAWVHWVYRRDASFAKTLRTEINPIWLRRQFRRISRTHSVSLETLGEEQFLLRLMQPYEFQTTALRRSAGRSMKIIQALNWKNWIGRMLVGLQAHYPIVLVARRQ